jgi:hypothetical protein
MEGAAGFSAVTFTSVCGQSRRGIAQVDAAGNLTAWNPNPDGALNNLLVTGGVVYVDAHPSRMSRVRSVDLR